MPLRLTADAKVQISSDAGTTFVNLGFVDDFRLAFDEADDDDHFFYGDPVPYTITGSETYDLTVSGAYDPADPGQSRAIAAKKAASTVLIRIFHAAKAYDQFSATVRSYDFGGNRNDDKYLTTSYGIRGFGVITSGTVV